MSEKNPSFLDNNRKVGKKSKQICLMYKKGRCKYTSEQCRFSHTIGEKLIQRLTENCEEIEPKEEPAP
uniref:C3H1-type domain-containing protein n=1 Tax=Romanomermis culicivorax TaxID=13658 RepID=A0A915IIE4_ROMCU